MTRAVDGVDGAEAIALRLADPQQRLAGVRLAPEMVLPGDLEFGYQAADHSWLLRLPPTKALRMEYRLELRHRDGVTELVCDPANPHRVTSAFGDRSVLEFPGYQPPVWLDAAAAPGSWRDLVVPSRALRSPVAARIWSPDAGADRLVVAHDGPEYDGRARLGQYVAATLASGGIQPCHLVLLAPGDRNEWYSANPAYSRALVSEVLVRVHSEVGTAGPVVAMGASLGALAMLAAQRRYPAAFSGLFLQSGSFFQPRYDSQESRFRRYRRIVRFVAELRRATVGVPVRTVLTCGQVEENLANNGDMAATLRRLGYPTTLREVPDGHNFTAWRDALDPGLGDLLRSVWPATDREHAAGWHGDA